MPYFSTRRMKSKSKLHIRSNVHSHTMGLNAKTFFFLFVSSFPSPCVIVKGRQTSDLSVRKLFQSPMKFQLSPVKKTVRFSNFFRTKSLSFSSDYSPDSDASPLARMIVSPFDLSSASSTDSGILK